MDHLLKVDHVYYTYPEGTAGLRDISFSLYKGETLGIAGANGAGKTTLVNHLNGFLLPSEGTIEVQGVVLCKKNREQIRKRIGIVFQNPEDQLFMSHVGDDIAFGPVNLGWSEGEINWAVEEVVETLGIAKLIDKTPYQLSQGQKRFVAIATVLVMKPEIVVLDEPTSDLDPGNRRKLINILKVIGGTQIIISHDLDFLWDTCKRVLVLDNGTIAADGATEQILASGALLESCGLELPLRMQNIC
jgi:cobalt/nickel transport system ATP-binding protein